MNRWYSPSVYLPDQGKKVLCFTNGDVDVRQRFKDYWIPIPYTDSSVADMKAPELWQEIDFPEPYTGYIKAMKKNKIMTIDEFEKNYPKDYEIFVENLINGALKEQQARNELDKR